MTAATITALTEFMREPTPVSAIELAIQDHLGFNEERYGGQLLVDWTYIEHLRSAQQSLREYERLCSELAKPARRGAARGRLL